MSNYQAVCGCNWAGKIYSDNTRASGSADVHNMVSHHGEPVIIQITHTDAALNGHIEATRSTK